MPARPKVTRDDIANAALAIVREEGHEHLTARAVAARLGCSTQPVLYHFASMDELRTATYQAADELHSTFLTDGIEGEEEPLLALGQNYVRFAHDEPQLFRFLVQSGAFDGKGLMTLVEDPALSSLVGMVQEATDLGADQAKAVFLAMFVAAHGFASLVANNAVSYDEAQVATVLEAAFIGALQSSAEATAAAQTERD